MTEVHLSCRALYLVHESLGFNIQYKTTTKNGNLKGTHLHLLCKNDKVSCTSPGY